MQVDHSPNSEFRVERTLSPQEVQWNRVLELLISRFRIPPREAKKGVNSLVTHLSRPLELRWYGNQKLTILENQIAASTAEVTGADTLRFRKESKFSIGFITVGFVQDILIKPQFRDVDGLGSCHAELKLQCGKFERKFTKFSAVALLRLAALTFLICCYVVLALLLFYGIAAFITLLQMPVEGVIAATSNGKIGLALLAFLVGFAGLSGRVIRDLFQRLRKRSKF